MVKGLYAILPIFPPHSARAELTDVGRMSRGCRNPVLEGRGPAGFFAFTKASRGLYIVGHPVGSRPSDYRR